MKRILFTLTILSTFVFANADTNKQITDTKAQIAELQASLKKLEDSLTTQAQKNEKIALAKKVEDEKLKIHAEFGFVSTSGNTDTTTYSLDSKLNKSLDKHLFTLSFDAQYADDSNIQTKNKYLIELQYDYEFMDKLAFTYLAGFKQDKFSGYKYQAYTGPGLTYKAIEEEKHKLSLEGNLLYSKDKLDNSTVRNYTSIRTKGIYKWQILDNLKFSQELSHRVETEDTKNYFVFSKTALTSKISDMFSFGINYKIDYVNTPPVSTKHNDRTLTANLIVDY